MKILFFNRFFHPDTSATSQIVSDLAFHLAASGYEVHAVTSRVPGAAADRETIRGVTVHRVATAGETHGLFARALAYLGYYQGARKAVRDLVQDGDIVVAKTDPPLLSAAIGPLAKRRGAKVVAWLQDVFPEVAREYGIPGMGWPLGSIARHVRNRSLRKADRIVVIGDHMATRIAAASGVGTDRIDVIHNWADGQAILPVAADRNALRDEWGMREDFIVGYSGNLGRVHEFETLLAGAERMRDDPGVKFLFIGRGPRLEEVREIVELKKLRNVRFESHQPREKLAMSLGLPDVHISVLRPEFEGLVHPSKLYGILAAGRPTIFIGDTRGETAAIIEGVEAGIAVSTGDVDALCSAIHALRRDKATRHSMGLAARAAFDEKYAMSHALHYWRTLLDSVVSR